MILMLTEIVFNRNRNTKIDDNDNIANWLYFLKENKVKLELAFSIACGISLGSGFIIEKLSGHPFFIHHGLYALAYILGTFFFMDDVFKSLAKGKFEIDFLMLVAAIGAAILDKWSEGALLLFLFSLGHSLELYAMKRANKSIEALTTLAPKMALVRRSNSIVEIPVEKLVIGDIVIIKPNSIISADGIVITGQSSVNQASITGESMPVDKFACPDKNERFEHVPGLHKVFSGSLNGNGYLEIKVSKETKDSTLSRLIPLVNEAKEKQSDTQNFTKKIERVFVPTILLFIALLNFAFLFLDETFADSFYRSITVLVVASPCALVISTPSAILSGIARGARSGILFKGGKPLENLAKIKAIAFDKTGTLTKGEPKITDIISLSEHSKTAILRDLIAIEQLSDHPLAKAIVKDGMNKIDLSEPLPMAENFESLTGKGVKATIHHEPIVIGNKELFGKALPSEVDERIDKLENEGKTTIIIKKNNVFVGIVALMDTPRTESNRVIQLLNKVGIKRIIMLSGDNQPVATSVANQIGIKEAWGNLLPEDKVAAINQLAKEERQVAMVGDGVNDAPAMAASNVAVAMGAAGSDVALETADIALMSDRLHNLPFAIGLSKKTKSIIRQNIIISLSVILIMIPVTLFGLASIGPAVLIHEGSTVLVVFNALRLLNYKLQN